MFLSCFSTTKNKKIKKKSEKKTKRWRVRALSLFGTCRRSDFLGTKKTRKTRKTAETGQILADSEVEMAMAETALYLGASEPS